MGWYRGSKGVGVTLSGARQAALRALDTAAAAVGNFLRTLLRTNWVLGVGLIFA